MIRTLQAEPVVPKTRSTCSRAQFQAANRFRFRHEFLPAKWTAPPRWLNDAGAARCAALGRLAATARHAGGDPAAGCRGFQVYSPTETLRPCMPTAPLSWGRNRSPSRRRSGAQALRDAPMFSLILKRHLSSD
jgi:hypothetical protein